MTNTTTTAGWGQLDRDRLWASPSQDPEAERAVLGTCLHSRIALTAVSDVLTAADFSRPAHRILWPAMLALHHTGRPVNPITLGRRLRREGQLRRVGGRDYLTRLAVGASSFAAVDHYAAIVVEAAWTRQLRQIGKDLVSATTYGTDPAALNVQALNRLTAAAGHYREAKWILAAATGFEDTTADPWSDQPAGQTVAVRISV